MPNLHHHAPAVTVGIPAGVDPENVRSRKAAHGQRGHAGRLAEGIATTAAHQQHLRDTKQKETPVVKSSGPVTERNGRRGQEGEGQEASRPAKPPKKIVVPTSPADPTAAVPDPPLAITPTHLTLHAHHENFL